MLAVLLCALLASSTAVADASLAQPVAQSASSPGIPEKLTLQLHEKLVAAQTKLNRFVATFEPVTHLPPGATQAEAIEYQALLNRLTQTYQTHLDDLSALEAIRQRRKDFEQTSQAWEGFVEKPPYSILLADAIRDTIQSLEKKNRMQETAQAFMDRLGDDTSAVMESSDEKIRHLNEQLENQKESVLVVRLNWLRELEQTRRQAAAATVSSCDTKRIKMNAELDENRQRLEFARQQLKVATQHACFTQRDLDKVLGSLNKERSRLKGEELSTYARLEASHHTLENARTNLQAVLQDTVTAVSTPDTLRHLQEIVETRDLQAQANAEIVTCLRQLLRGVDIEQQLWQTRFAVLEKQDAVEMQQACKKLNKLYELILSAKPYYEQLIELTTGRIAEQQNTFLNSSGARCDPALAMDRRETFQQQAEAYRRVLTGLEKHEHMIKCWQEAFEGTLKTHPINERVQGFFSRVANIMARTWNFELLVVNDTITVEGREITGRRGITVGKVISAILIVLIGYLISKRIARWLERLVISRLKIEPNQANLIRRWSHVILVALLVLFSLVSVKIPLTIFAFAGGALAIGVGFGTQNLLKNFISGIIILFERPFRVGDVLDVAGQRGRITCIGIRSSVLQLWDGTETLIPNSALLENNLTNWTYSNQTVRFIVTVGVAYGSDTRSVAQVLSDVAERHGVVQKEPKPQVIFTQFGDNALSFDLLFWVDVSKHNAAQVSSDLRHMIAGSFAEHGIIMAFPQRDLHLDTAAPLQIQMVPPPETRGLPESLR